MDKVVATVWLSLHTVYEIIADESASAEYCLPLNNITGILLRKPTVLGKKSLLLYSSQLLCVSLTC